MNNYKAYTTLALASLLACAGCKAPKDIAYFQDMPEHQAAAVQEVRDIRVQPSNKLVITIKSKDQELTQMLNLTPGTQSSSQSPSNSYAYTVDNEGCIDMPMLGKVHVGGMTRPEIGAYIKGQLIGRGIVLDPVVNVEYKDLTFSVLGEVRNPGSFNVTQDRVTLLQALAKAGDLQITGNRTNVSVVRLEGGEEKHYFVDLTNAQSLAQSPVYYIQQDDVVYVEPNAKRKRESRPNGNTFNTASFWIGITSTIASLTSIIVALTK